MRQRLLLLALVFGCHTASFVALYFGRHSSLPACNSDLVLFDGPFIAATTAYAFVYAGLIAQPGGWLRRVLLVTASIGTAIVSLVAGMTIAFNVWGT